MKYSGNAKLRIMMCNVNAGVSVPRYGKQGDSGMDVQADITEPLTLLPGQRALVPTGIKLGIPEGFEVQARPRSGLAHKNGISIVNAPGTIDMGYRGEIKVNLINLGGEPFTVEPAMRIAQLVLTPVYQAVMEVVNELDETERGEAGYGSTGTH